MKHKGSHFEFEKQRNEELLKAFESVSSADPYRPLIDRCALAVGRRCSRYWVSQERAFYVISKMLNGIVIEGMRDTRKSMYNDILEDVKFRMSFDRSISVYDAVFDVINSPAAGFYLTPDSARVIIIKARKKWLEERRKKYRHLFM